MTDNKQYAKRDAAFSEYMEEVGWWDFAMYARLREAFKAGWEARKRVVDYAVVEREVSGYVPVSDLVDDFFHALPVETADRAKQGK